MRNLAFLAALSFVANVLADAAPEPPPKGKKYVNVENSVAVDKSVTGYVFVMSVAEGRRAGPPDVTYLSIKLGEKPLVLSAYGKIEVVPGPLDRHLKAVTNVFTIPADAAKKYDSEKELLNAVAARTVPGMHRLGLTCIDTIASDDKRKSIPWTYTITAIDAKTGITATKERDGKPVEAKEPGTDPDDHEPQVRDVGNAHWMIGGFFATAAFVSSGLWLVGRKRQP
jgi:hypothetical protein